MSVSFGGARTRTRTLSVSSPAIPKASGPRAEILELDDAQYNALLDDAAADMLHARLRSEVPGLQDARSASALCDWYWQIIDRTQALGLHTLDDLTTFAALALQPMPKALPADTPMSLRDQEPVAHASEA